MTTQTALTEIELTSGSFCWNEIATREPESVKAFYTAMFGWDTEETNCGGVGYTLFKVDGKPIGGMLLMDETWPEDAQTHWGSYIYCDDVDMTADRVADCGGTVCYGPIDAPEGGRLAILNDPCGAVISLYKGGDSKSHYGYGAFCWNELLTTDTDASASFYTNLFAWSRDAGPDPDNSDYAVFTDNGMPKCGLMAMHWEGKPSWLGYVNVENVDEMTEKAASLGAHVCAPPSDIPNIGRFSVITDPTGGTIGLFSSITGCPAGSCECPEQSNG